MTTSEDKAKAYLDKLRDHVTRLKALLDDPQPGLISWCMMYGAEMEAIVRLWEKGDTKASKTL